MLEPKKPKWRRHHRGRMAGPAKGGYNLSFGVYGLQAMECGWVTARQIEAARIAISRFKMGLARPCALGLKRGGKVGPSSTMMVLT